MRILTSTSALKELLDKFDMDEHAIDYITVSKSNYPVFHSGSQSEELNCHILEKSTGYIKQDSRRWDWIRDLTYQINERPISIEIHENIVNVILQH